MGSGLLVCNGFSGACREWIGACKPVTVYPVVKLSPGAPTHCPSPPPPGPDQPQEAALLLTDSTPAWSRLSERSVSCFPRLHPFGMRRTQPLHPAQTRFNTWNKPQPDCPSKWDPAVGASVPGAVAQAQSRVLLGASPSVFSCSCFQRGIPFFLCRFPSQGTLSRMPCCCSSFR